MNDVIEEKLVKMTNEFELYEKGKNFLASRNYFEKTKKNIDFYQDNQWNNCELGDVPPVSYNFIKPVVKYKVSALDTYEYQIIFNSNNYETEELSKTMDEVCKKLNSHIAVIWELNKIDEQVRRMKKLAAITGESILFFRFKPDNIDMNKDSDEDLDGDVLTGEVDSELLMTTDVFYANENDPNIQNQPYIIIKQRKNLDDVIEEAKNNERPLEEILKITADKEVQAEVSENAQYEVNDTVLVVTKLYKKDGLVYCKRATRTAVIQEEQCLGLQYYPLVHYCWEEDIGSARGLGEVERLIPNQIEANRTLVRRAIIIKMIAFPKPVINTNFIKNPSAVNKIGATIEIDGSAADNISNYFGYIQPTQTSSEAVALQNELIQTSRELANAADVATGAINPEQASGKSILAVQQAAQQPLTEQLYRFKDVLEEIGIIIFDIWKAYNTAGMKVYSKKENKNLKEIDDGNNKYEVEKITSEELNKLRPYIKIDITPRGSYDKLAQEQSYENLLVKRLITFEEFVELIGMDSSMNKRALTRLIQKRQEKQAKIEEMQQQVQARKTELENQLKTEAMANQVDADIQIDNIAKQTAQQADSIIGGGQ